MDVDGPVTSPTYVLARVHPARRAGTPAMIHVDVYRLLDPADQRGDADLLGELDSLDLDAELDDAVVVVEWGEGLAERLSERHLVVRLRAGQRIRCADRDLAVELLVSLILALDTATPAVTAGDRAVGRLGLRRAGRAGHRRRSRTRRTAHPKCAGRARRCRADDVRSGRRRGGLRARSVHRSAGRYGDAPPLMGMPLASRCGASAAWTPSACERAATSWWSPTPVGERSIGRDTTTDAAHTVRRSMRPPTSIVERRGQWRARRSMRRCSSCRACEPVYPTAAGLVSSVPDWSEPALPLVALYLRRPDAKPLAARQ